MEKPSQILQEEIKKRSEKVVTGFQRLREIREEDREAGARSRELNIIRRSELMMAARGETLEFILFGLEKETPRLSIITGTSLARAFALVVPNDDPDHLQVKDIDKIRGKTERLKRIAARLPNFLENIQGLVKGHPVAIYLSFQDRRKRNPAAVAEKYESGTVRVSTK